MLNEECSSSALEQATTLEPGEDEAHIWSWVQSMVSPFRTKRPDAAGVWQRRECSPSARVFAWLGDGVPFGDACCPRSCVSTTPAHRDYFTHCTYLQQWRSPSARRWLQGPVRVSASCIFSRDFSDLLGGLRGAAFTLYRISMRHLADGPPSGSLANYD
jgi:hypothetical protein